MVLFKELKKKHKFNPYKVDFVQHLRVRDSIRSS